MNRSYIKENLMCCKLLMSKEYRDYSKNKKVEDFYKEKNTKMTLEYTQQQILKFQTRKRIRMHILDALDRLDQIFDESDPDTSLSQSKHAFQTAEVARRLYPTEDWLHLTALIHDMGKIMKLTMPDVPHWAIVGDTYPMGHPFSDKIVHSKYFIYNPDSNSHSVYSGSFSESKSDSNPTCKNKYPNGIGFNRVTMAWGHDEYMYRVLEENNNKHFLPGVSLYIIRYHSFYAWHQHREYGELANILDHQYLPELQKFQNCDLYSKTDEILDKEKLLPYYRNLINKFFVDPILEF